MMQFVGLFVECRYFAWLRRFSFSKRPLIFEESRIQTLAVIQRVKSPHIVESRIPKLCPCAIRNRDSLNVVFATYYPDANKHGYT